MSLDYPNRTKWLSVRQTGSNAQFRLQYPPRVLWLSKKVLPLSMPDGTVKMVTGGARTYVRKLHGPLGGRG